MKQTCWGSAANGEGKAEKLSRRARPGPSLMGGRGFGTRECSPSPTPERREAKRASCPPSPLRERDGEGCFSPEGFFLTLSLDLPQRHFLPGLLAAADQVERHRVA